MELAKYPGRLTEIHQPAQAIQAAICVVLLMLKAAVHAPISQDAAGVCRISEVASLVVHVNQAQLLVLVSEPVLEQIIKLAGTLAVKLLHAQATVVSLFNHISSLLPYCSSLVQPSKSFGYNLQIKKKEDLFSVRFPALYSLRSWLTIKRRFYQLAIK